MTKAEMKGMIEHIFTKVQELRAAGQAEYAHRDESAFANFERVAERINISREKVLLIYFEKHIDGIHSYVHGHKSQREDVRGRILDAIVYLCLLYGMVEENDQPRVTRLQPSDPEPTEFRRLAEDNR